MAQISSLSTEISKTVETENKTELPTFNIPCDLENFKSSYPNNLWTGIMWGPSSIKQVQVSEAKCDQNIPLSDRIVWNAFHNKIWLVY